LGPVIDADRGALEYQPPAPQNQPPTGSLVVTPSTGNAPLPVTADGSGSVDPEGGRIASYRFDFGDGTVVGPQPGATAAHTFATGNWTVTLTVTDSLGAVGSATAPVAVGDTAQTVAGVSPPSSVRFAPRLTPNPLRTSAQLAFELGRPTPVQVSVFDLGGRLVRTMSSGASAGRNVMVLDGLADGGVPLRSGVYLYEIRAGSQRAVGRFVVMR
jgi:hypothetical protein